MKKKLKKNTNKKTPRKIGGWLIVVLIILLCSVISAFSLLIQKINAIVTKNTGFGVYISAILLVFYLFFLCLKYLRGALSASPCSSAPDRQGLH